MRTAILVNNPSFGLNMSSAFGLRGEVRLMSATPSDYRRQEEGLLLTTPATRQEAKDYINHADLVFVAGMASLTCLGLIGGERWVKWLKDLCKKRLKLVLFACGTTYFFNTQFYDGLVDDLGATFFMLPNLLPLTNLKAVPLLYPHQVNQGDKAQIMTIIHSPGNKRKMEIKGTALIEQVISQLQKEGLDFNYHRLEGKTHQECLEIKATAHIFIDQLPPEGWPHGLGNSGIEGLAAGMAVLSDMYDQSVTDGYFERPPVIDVKNKDELYWQLAGLIADHNRRDELGRQGQQWVKDNLEFKPWLDYVERYIG